MSLRFSYQKKKNKIFNDLLKSIEYKYNYKFIKIKMIWIKLRKKIKTFNWTQF